MSWGWVELRKQALPLFRCSSLWKPQGLNPFRQQRAEGPGVAEEVWLGAQQLMAETGPMRLTQLYPLGSWVLATFLAALGRVSWTTPDWPGGWSASFIQS